MNSGKEQKLVSIISSFFLSIIFISSAFAACPPSVISYWRLDEVSGNQYLELVANNNGTCSGECPAPLENGRIGGAQLFNASTTGIDVPPDAVYDWTVEESFTIEFWIKHDALGSPQEETVIGRDDSGNSSLNWRVGVKTGAAAFTLRAKNGDEHSVTGTSDVTDGAWHHIAAVRDADSNQIILYVDGAIEAVKNATYTAGFDSITAALNIGWLNASPYFRFGGIIDELAIHNLALADSEIQQHYYDGHIGLRWGYCSCDLPVRILPLGDSITKGYMTLEESDEFRVGFRQKLFLDLLHLGYDIDFVGGLKAGSLTIPSFDIDHEGHSGFRDDQVAAGVYNWLTNNPADVILLHIGTNGLQANPTDVAAILNEIDRYSEDIVVVLARIINQKSYSPLTTDFNDNVETMAMGRIANGDKIIIVDQENALTDPEDFADVIHPNMSGYEKMAGPWIEALTQFLPFCNETSPVIFSVPPTKAFNGTYYSYDVKAGGGPKPRYFLSTAPSGAMIDAKTGSLDWTPGSFGPFEFTVRASNYLGDDYQSFVVNVGSIDILDNGDIGTSTTGNWFPSSGPNSYSSQSVYNKEPGGGAFTFTSGNIIGPTEVYLWWTQTETRCTSVPIKIYDGTTLLDDSVRINQKINGGQWNLIGTYTFNGNAKLVIVSQGDTCSTSADAVNFTHGIGNKLDRTRIEGPLTVMESSENDYNLRAYFTDGMDALVNPDTWGIDCPGYAEINPNGGLTAYTVNSDEICHITASYTKDHLKREAVFEIFIKDTQQLESLRIEGPAAVNDNTSTDYNLRAYYTDGSDQAVDSGSWDIDCPAYGSITAAGLLSTLDVVADQACRISAVYGEGGTTREATLDITIRDNAEIIVDDGGSGTSYTGDWFPSSGPNFYGTGSLFNRQAGGGRYTFQAPAAGTAEVSLWWTVAATRCDNVKVEIYDGARLLDDTLRLDQKSGGGRWNPLGTYSFGGTARVVIVSETDACSSCADALRIVQATPRVLESLRIEGPAAVNDNTSTDYNLRAYYTDGSDQAVDSGSWDIDCPAYGSITAAGLLSTLDVVADQACRISAVYGEGGTTREATLDITIRDNAEIIVDDGGSGTSYTGDWFPSSGPNFYGTRSLFNRQAGGGRYTFQAPAAGTAEVSLWWTVAATRCDNVKVEIYDGARLLDDTLRLDQKSGGGRWNPLGTYSFGGTARVVIVSETDACSSCADALRIVQATPRVLESLRIEGPAAVNDNTSTDYNLRAYYTDGSDQAVDSGSWDIDCPAYGSITAAGLLSTLDVVADQACRISAVYGEGGTTREATLDITIRDNAEIIVDDGGSGTSYTGDWFPSSGPNFYGTGSLFNRQAGGGRYTFQAPVAGTAEVSLWWTVAATRCDNVKVEIYDGARLLDDTLRLDQKSGGGRWNPLGTYSFGGTARVVIVSETDACSSCADALRIVK